MNRKERQKRGVSILLMLLMVLTTMMPSWAYGTETTGASAADQLTSETSGETSDGSDAKQPGAADRNVPADTETSGGTQDTAGKASSESADSQASGSASSDSRADNDAEAGEYFAVISADRAGADKSKDAPYIEAGMVKLEGSRSVEVKKDKLSKQDSGAYKGSQNLNDSGAGYSDGNSYEVALRNYYGDNGSARDGYRLEGIDINGYMIRMSEIEADSDHHIHIARGSISGYDGDADAYVNSENGKDIGLSFAGSGAFSSDLKVTFTFADDAARSDHAASRQAAVKAAKASAKAAAAESGAAASHENQVRVIVENTTYPQSEGAPWDGTLVDTWVDLNDDSTMMSCIVAALDTVGAEQTGAESNYISEINGLGEFDGGYMSGWMGTLNDWFTSEGFVAFTVADGKLSAGDEIRIMYTCAYGDDLGGSWGNNDKRVADIEVSAGTLSPEFDKDVHEYTLDLPAGTEKVTVRPSAVNKNFQVRTFAGDTEYKRNDAIPVSSGMKISVRCGDPSWSSMNDNSEPVQEYTLTVNSSSAPVLKDGIPESTIASVKKGQAYTLDLDSIFEDPQNGKLTYTVSVDGAEAVSAESGYSVKFDSPGTHTLVFRASNGKASSEAAYTVELTVEKPEQAKLESLIIHTGTSPTDTSVLVKNKGDKYTSGSVFDADTSDYVLAAQTDSVTQLRFRAKPDDSSAKVKVYYGDGQSKDITWKSGSSKSANCLSPGKNTITIKVEPASGSDKEGSEYRFTVDCMPTLTGITAESGGAGLYLDKAFSASTDRYTLTIPDTAETVELTAVPKNSSYTILYNGKESSSVDVKGREKIEITVAAGNGDSRLENVYTLDLKRAAELDFKADVTPADAIVKVYDSEGAEVKKNSDGSFSGLFADSDYTYIVTRYGYVAQSGIVPKSGGRLDITLEKAADDGLKDVSSDWNNFRGSDSNMGITDVMTPVSKEDTTLLWNAKLGSGWTAAPSVQIIVDDALIVMAGTTIYKLDLRTGETLKTGTMAGSPSYGYTPPAYAEGMIFCPLGSGTIQAFNAETLESLWIYRDPLKGQALSPITYSNGYIYTGFWNSETKDADYVCISVTDEDVTRPDESKQATWRHRQSGGYYWAGSAAAGNCIIVGSDDGEGGTSGDSTLTSYDRSTGEVISELRLKGAGDQRSSIAYEKESGRVYFTTKGGYLCSAAVDEKTGELSSLKMVNYNAQSTSTPVVYKGNVYFATGSGISSSGSSGNFVVADADTLEMRYAVGLKGYPQCSMLMSTAYEDEGYLYFYATYNMKPGGISMIKVRNDSKTADDAELIELYDAEGFEEYCISSIICDRNGTLYYKNDSGNVFAVGLPDYKTVRNLIDRIGEVTLDSRSAIDTARKAYDALSDENKEKVTNYDKLTAAEQRFAQLEADKKKEEEKKNQSGGTSTGSTSAASGTTRSAGTVTKTADVKISGELTEKAKAVIEKIKAVNSSDLPEKAESFTEDQIRSVTEAYKAYNELSAAEKKAAESDDSWKAFAELTDRLGRMYHYDKDSGIDVRDNKETSLPWYIKLKVTAEKLSSSQEADVKAVLGEDSEIFTMNDISFVNTLDGSEWHPDELIKVKMPSADIGSYKSAIIVHISDDGKVQLIEGSADEADGTVSFESSEFSLYGIAGSMESVDSLLGAQQRADVMPWLILAGAAAAALIVIACLKIRRRKKADR